MERPPYKHMHKLQKYMWMLLRDGHQLERLPRDGHNGPLSRRDQDPLLSIALPPELREPQDLNRPLPTNLSANVGLRNPQAQGYRPPGMSSGSNQPAPSVEPGLQFVADEASGQSAPTQVDGLTSHGLPRSPGSTDNFVQTNCKSCTTEFRTKF